METKRVLFENGRLKRVKPIYRCDSGNAKDELVRSSMRRACKLKGAATMVLDIDAEPPIFPAENHSNLVEAFEAFESDWSDQDNRQAIAFERIIRNLPSQDLVILACAIETKYYRNIFGIEVEFESEVKGPNILISGAVPILIAVFMWRLVYMLTSTSGHSSWGKPYGEAGINLCMVLLISAVMLKDKNPRLSKIMIKVSVAAINFSLLFTCAQELHPFATLILGLPMAFIVIRTLWQF